MSIIGGIISVFQYAGQRVSSNFCSREAVDCSFSYISGFGYITIPVMALTSFVGIIILLLLGKEKK